MAGTSPAMTKGTHGFADHFRHRAGAVLRRAGFDRLSRLGAGALCARRDRRILPTGSATPSSSRRGRAFATGWRRSIAPGRRAWARITSSTVDALAAISDTALTRDVEIEIAASGLPTTFVPGRNLVFFCFAGALAYRRGAKHLVAGMCETDYSGYPDCRDDTIKAMQVALGLGMDRRFVIHTPLMWIDKAATFGLAQELGGDAFVDLLVEETHTCYLGDRSHRHAWGYGCGECPACRLRAQGFAKWQASR